MTAHPRLPGGRSARAAWSGSRASPGRPASRARSPRAFRATASLSRSFAWRKSPSASRNRSRARSASPRSRWSWPRLSRVSGPLAGIVALPPEDERPVEEGRRLVVAPAQIERVAQVAGGQGLADAVAEPPAQLQGLPVLGDGAVEVVEGDSGARRRSAGPWPRRRGRRRTGDRPGRTSGGPLRCPAGTCAGGARGRGGPRPGAAAGRGPRTGVLRSRRGRCRRGTPPARGSVAARGRGPAPPPPARARGPPRWPAAAPRAAGRRVPGSRRGAAARSGARPGRPPPNGSPRPAREGRSRR